MIYTYFVQGGAGDRRGSCRLAAREDYGNGDPVNRNVCHFDNEHGSNTITLRAEHHTSIARNEFALHYFVTVDMHLGKLIADETSDIIWTNFNS
jgi:hypothetical protein